MTHTPPLLTMIVAGLGLAFVFGTLAHRLRISPLVGYLVAGIVVGPFTPGFVADQGLGLQLAEIGVILLMFGVGLHFSLNDLWVLRKIVIPGATLQVIISSLLGMGAAAIIGWPLGAGVVFGIALAVASTVVLTRALQERRLMETERGHITVGWMVTQDFLMILALVLIPAFASVLRGDAPGAGGVDAGALLLSLGVTFGKLAAFIVLMLVVGRRVIPAVLHFAAHTGSRELFRLAVLSVALGVAFTASTLFDVSFALGAFFAGMVLSESTLSARAAEESLPLRDAFAVLFFVSVGMLFNPAVLIHAPLALALTALVVLVGNALVAFFVVRLLGRSVQTALMLAAGLAQIGEFSFILADLGTGLGILPVEARNLILGTSILSILVNPALFAIAGRLQARWAPPAPAPSPEVPAPDETAPALVPTGLADHVILVGFGRVGSLVGKALQGRGERFLVIEDMDKSVAALRRDNIEVIPGNAVRADVLAAANAAGARILFIAIPNCFEAGQIVEQARAANPRLEIVARAHSNDEVEYLARLSADIVIMGEREIARGMIEHAFGQAV
jgi:CPA2 family monovalent cation:H+ antiporter-2